MKNLLFPLLLIFTLAMACSKQEKLEVVLPSIPIESITNPVSFEDWMELPLCEKRSFDTWMPYSINAVLKRSPDTAYLLTSEGVTGPPSLPDSLIFTSDSMIQYFVPVSRYPPRKTKSRCIKDTILNPDFVKPNYLSVDIIRSRYQNLPIEVTTYFKDTLMYRHYHTPIIKETKYMNDCMRHWYEVDEVYVLRTSKFKR